MHRKRLIFLVLIPFFSWASDVELRAIDENASDKSTASYASAGSDFETSESSSESDKTPSASPPTLPPPLPVSNRDLSHDNDEILIRPSQGVNDLPPTFNSDNIPQRWPTLARPAKAYIVCQGLMEIVSPALVGISYNGDETVALAALFSDCAIIAGRLIYGCVLNHPHEGWFKKCFRHALLQTFSITSTLAAWDYYNYILRPGDHSQSFGWGGSLGTSITSSVMFFIYANNQ